MDKISAIILAAGKGTRMHSDQTNKVMLPLNGKPMVSYTVENMQRAGLTTIIMVVGFAKESVMEYFEDRVQYAFQEEQKGTAHALTCGLSRVPDDHQTILLVYGDDSFTYPPVLYQKLITAHHEQHADVTILSVYLEDPSGLGRIVRDDQQRIVDIVEEKNATVEQKRIREINTGCYVFSRPFLTEYLPQITDENAAHEYLLTDIIRLAVKNGKTVADVRETNLRWRGVNRPEELEQAQATLL
ncbi:NTP transferase domain-containing protein, partial [Candidatus Roizmanbacteria bacterium]|nr:NTP transferase domain-containing protein [Candidatus Roizmanbacteria bacterium]